MDDQGPDEVRLSNTTCSCWYEDGNGDRWPRWNWMCHLHGMND